MSRVDDDHRAFVASLPKYHFKSIEDMRRLPEYSATNPTGVFPGKVWRRHDGLYDRNARLNGLQPRWIICTYEEIPDDPTMCKNGRYRPVVRIKMRRRVGVDGLLTDPR
jgi:hypothetical protein